MESDFLIIGSGIAGLSYALKCAELGTVVVVTKKQDIDTATNLAQGGIAAVMDSGDSVESHLKDTLESGAGLCDEAVVRMVVESGAARVKDLVELGVNFVKDKQSNSGYSLGKEGGHSNRRVVHAYDLTGREIERALLEKARNHPNIQVLEQHIAIDLLLYSEHFPENIWPSVSTNRCVGAYVMADGHIETYLAKITTLCSGGCGKVYLYTTNPDIATGDGMAMSFRAGAEMSNMEFVQFHPTCLYSPKEKTFLISEAVRGEGGILVDSSGYPFMSKYDQRKDLATRDTVARAIDSELKEKGQQCVFLDITSKSREFLKNRFPTIFQKCLSIGIDISTDPIPVVPAAHYMCGGVKTDINGRSSIPGLMVLGETACTGLHGGNRLASNSLLEAVVFSHQAASFCRQNNADIKNLKTPEIEPWQSGNAKCLNEEILINHNWDAIRRVMWNYVGIVRSLQRLSLAKTRMEAIYSEINQHYHDFLITPNMVELRNIALIAMLIIQSAGSRKESRGLHYLVDHRDRSSKVRQTVFKRKIGSHEWGVNFIESLDKD